MSDSLFSADELSDLFDAVEEEIKTTGAPVPVPAAVAAPVPVPPAARPVQIPYAELSYLVIEDSSMMRTWLHQAISDAGGKKIELSESYFDALNRIKNKGDYDVVLCDYILSDTRDGQQLLEEVRRNKLLPQSTLWIMITGERAYEQVFSAAELAPDDYLIKPITPGLLADRLKRAWERRSTLKAATKLFDGGRYEEALAVCRKMTESRARFSIGFRRIAGECLLALERYLEAHDHFEAVLEEFPRLPWAKLGKGRAFFHLDNQDETQEILEDLIAGNPDFLAAHDLLAKVHERKGDLEKARDLLKLVLEKNPKALHRHRDVVRVSLATGDSATAIEAFALMHQHGRGSSFLRPGDFCEYAGLLMNSGSKAAKERLAALGNSLRDFYRNDPEFSFSQSMVGYAMAKTDGNAEVTRKAYDEMRKTLERAREANTAVDTSAHLTMMTAAAEMGDLATVESCANALYSDHNGNDSMIQRINLTLEKVGLTNMATMIRNKTSEEMRSLNLAAVNLANHGKIKEAIEEFMRLAESKHSVSVYLNAATALVMLFEEVGKGRQTLTATERKLFVGRLDYCIAYVRKHDPGNTKVAKIAEEWKRLAQRT